MSFLPLIIFWTSFGTAHANYTPLKGDLDMDTSHQKCLKLTKSICLPWNYDKNETPSKPTPVTAQIKIAQIDEVDDLMSAIQFTSWFEFEWTDNRFREIDENNTLGLKIDSKNHDLMWIPEKFLKVGNL